MKAIDILTAIAENYEVGNGIGIFNTQNYCEDLEDYIQYYFGKDIKVKGSIKVGYKYLYYYEYMDMGLYDGEHDAEIGNEFGDRIYLYRIEC